MKTIYLLIILQITSGAFFKDAIKVIKEHPKFEETQEVDQKQVVQEEQQKPQSSIGSSLKNLSQKLQLQNNKSYKNNDVESIEFDNLQYDIPQSEMVAIFTELRRFIDSQSLLQVLEQIMEHYYLKYRDEIDTYNAKSGFQKDLEQFYDDNIKQLDTIMEDMKNYSQNQLDEYIKNTQSIIKDKQKQLEHDQKDLEKSKEQNHEFFEQINEKIKVIDREISRMEHLILQGNRDDIIDQYKYSKQKVKEGILKNSKKSIDTNHIMQEIDKILANESAQQNELNLKNLLSLLLSCYVETSFVLKQSKLENQEDYFKNERFLETDIKGIQKGVKLFQDQLSQTEVKQANMNIEIKKLNQIYERESFILQEAQKQMKQFKFASNRNKARLKFEKEALSKSIAYIQHNHS